MAVNNTELEKRVTDYFHTKYPEGVTVNNGFASIFNIEDEQCADVLRLAGWDVSTVDTGYNVGPSPHEPPPAVEAEAPSCYTVAIIKPDTTASAAATYSIFNDICELGYKFVHMRRLRLGKEQAEALYAEHKGKSFCGGLIRHMTSGFCIALVLEKDCAISDWRRDLVGLREKYALDGPGEGPRNALHGCDSEERYREERSILFG